MNTHKYCIFKRSHKYSIKKITITCYVCTISCYAVYPVYVTKVRPVVTSILWKVCHAMVYPVIRTANYFCSLLQLRQPVRTYRSAWQIDL